MNNKLVLIIAFALFSFNGIAKGIYQQPDDFVNEAFDQSPPNAKVIWYRGDIRAQVSEILQHKPATLRQRYWLKGQRSVWVMNEIGKEKNITVGIIVNQGQLEKVKTLIFRESRGWEIRETFFTDQFTNRSLTADNQLDKNIDSITGATLSVRAVEKLSRIALLLHKKISPK